MRASTLRHVRETGALIAQLPKSKGGRGKTADTDVRSFFADSGIEERTARNWQSLATYISLNISSHAPRVMRTRESAAIGADPYLPQGVQAISAAVRMATRSAQ